MDGGIKQGLPRAGHEVEQSENHNKTSNWIKPTLYAFLRELELTKLEGRYFNENPDKIIKKELPTPWKTTSN
jgi:hypothetical protein